MQWAGFLLFLLRGLLCGSKNPAIRRPGLSVAALAIVLVCWLLPGCAAVALGEEMPTTVTVRPEETDALLANPSMGWETFHRTSQQDANLPAWIPSTVEYIRWGWNDLEPSPGVLNTELIDETLRRCHAVGQKLAFRVMCCSPNAEEPYHPAWLSTIPGGIVSCDYQGNSVSVANLNNPAVMKRHLEFLARLGERYNAHPHIDHLDIGSVGWWGEWHMSECVHCQMPSEAEQRQVIDAYLKSFSSTPLLMLIGGRNLAYATQHGAGWRADCLGDMGMFSSRWSHMRQGYPEMLTQAKAISTWKTAPVAFETCGDLRDWVRRGYSLRYVFNYALALHASYINNKSAPLPQATEVRSEVERFLRRLGYRLALKEMTHPKQMRPGSEFVVQMKWQNVGSAPCYKPYRLAFRLSSPTTHDSFIVRGTVQVHRWMPGDVPVFTPKFFESPPDLPLGKVYTETERLTWPTEIPAGRYRLAVAVVGDDNVPKVRLAIRGETADDWYNVSKVEVVK